MRKDWEADLLAQAKGQPIHVDEDYDDNDDVDNTQPEPPAVPFLTKLYNHLYGGINFALEHGQGELMNSLSQALSQLATFKITKNTTSVQTVVVVNYCFRSLFSTNGDLNDIIVR